jgi:hypothetical protein
VLHDALALARHAGGAVGRGKPLQA